MAGEITPVPSLDTSTLSSKQLDMANARHPMSGNQENQLLAEQTAANKALDDQRKGLASAQQVQQQQQVVPQAQTQTGSAAAGAMQKNLTTFSNRLAAKVNSLLGGSDVSKLQLADREALNPVWNPDTQMHEILDESEIGLDTTGIAADKQAQMAGLKQEMGGLFDYQDIGDTTNVQAKGFEEVLKQFADLDGDGQIDPEEQQYLNESFQIASAISRLEKLDPDSPEAKSLRAQLEMMDDKGLVSGIYRAMSQYQELIGSGKGPEFYGELGQDNFNMETLINMSVEDWDAELNRALIGEESLFGQDFESALTQNRLRSQAAKSMAFDAETRNALTHAAQYWGNETKSTLEEYDQEINDGFAKAYPQLQTYFQKLIADGTAAGQDTSSLEAALQWFDDIAKGAEQNSASQAIMQLISDPDSGLATTQRQTLAKWLGDITGTDVGATGIISGVINSLRDTGAIDVSWENSKGETERAQVEFTDSERLQVAKIMNDETLTDPEKAEKINAMVNRKIQERISAVGDIAAVKKYFEEGNFQTGLDVFAESLAKSLSTFANSATKFLWDKVVSSRPGEFTEGMEAGGDPRNFVDEQSIQAIQGAMEAQAKAMSNTINTAAANAGNIEKDIASANQDLQNLVEVSTNLQTLEKNQISTYRTQILDAVTNQGLDANFETLVSGWTKMAQRSGIPLDTVDWGQLDTYAEVFTMVNNLREMVGRGESVNAEIIKNNPLYAQYEKYINDPVSLVKQFNPFFGGDKLGGVSRSVLSSIGAMKRNLTQLVSGSVGKMYQASDFGKATADKRTSIEETRSRIRTYLKDADAALERLRNYTATGNKAISALTTFNPKNVADMAMLMARAAEAGATGPAQFIDLSKYDLSKEDFEKLANGYGSIPPLYIPNAVEGFEGDWGYVTPAGSAQELRQWAGGIVMPTPSRAATPYAFDTPNYQSPVMETIEEGVKALDPTMWSYGGKKIF